MKRIFTALLLAALVAVVLATGTAYAANPPLCPHITGWTGACTTFCLGQNGVHAPWIKVIIAADIPQAEGITGAKVYYRPWDADSYVHDDGCLPTSYNGTTFADMVWNMISGLTRKPDAITYRNEFNWDNNNPSNYQRTCDEFINYYDELRARGYTGKIIFSSFAVGWVDATTWQDSHLMAAVQKSDGVEVHEYFDLTVNCAAPWLCFRHRDIAIANNPYLQSKDWYIGEFNSDPLYAASGTCGDSQNRGCWNDRGKMSASAYIAQCQVYRAGCANQVVAVFEYEDGAYASADCVSIGTGVDTYLQTTWAVTTGTLTGNVKNSSSQNLVGATVSVSPGGATGNTDSNGNYTISNLAAGSYTATASMTGYNSSSAAVVITSGNTTTQNFTLSPLTTGTLSGTVRDANSVVMGGVTVATDLGGYQTTTAANGTYTLSNVLVGSYNVTASMTGYNSQTIPVSVTAGQTTSCSFGLSNQSGSLLSNGDFEAGFQSGVGNGWTTWTSSWSNPITFLDSTSPVHAGSHAQKWGRSDNLKVHGGVCQAVNVTSGYTYQITSDLRFTATDSGPWCEMGYDLTGQTTNGEATTVSYTKLESGGQNTWLPFSKNVTATGSKISIFAKFGQYNQGGSGPSWAYADDLSVVQIVSTTGTISGWVRNTAGTGISGVTVATNTGGYQTTTDSNGNYTLSSVTPGTYNVTASKTGYVSVTNSGVVVTANNTTTSTFTLIVASQAFESMPSWSSSYDATWGNAAAWSIVSGGQSGNFLQVSRTGQGSSNKAIVYTVPANTTITISVYMECPSYANAYWMESAYKFGSNAASDFDTNSSTWTYINKFSNTGTNGNGSTWTKYSVSANTGSNTQITIGYKLGAQNCNGPTVGWDTFAIQ